MHEGANDGLPEALEAQLWDILRTADDRRAERFAALAAEHPEHRQQIERFAAELGSTPSPAFSPPEETIGQYRLLRLLGCGGQGQVWLAEHAILGRQVALKLIHGELLRDDRARQRFEREARAASRLDHPGICRIFEVGDHLGLPFMAMQLVRGDSLADLLTRAAADERNVTLHLPAATTPEVPKEPVNRVVLLVEKIARAVQAAHAAGVIHRDLKPSNILIDAAGEPTIVDFGIARELDATGPGLTSTQTPGTPAFMAPEQVTGSPTDARTDVWALGVLLYQCLTLRRPFTGTTIHQVQQQILTAEPTPAHRLNRGVSRDLQTIVACAMQKDHRRRYVTAADLAEDLRRVRCFEPILARPTPLWHRMWRWCQRNRAAAVALAATALGLVVTTGLLHRLGEVQAGERQSAAQIALHAAANATGNGELLAAAGFCDTAITILDREGKGPTAEFSNACLRRAELAMLLEEPESAAVHLARLPATLSNAQQARALLLRGELQNSTDASPEGGLDLVREALATDALPLADRLYAEALLAPGLPESCDALVQARVADRKHLLTSRMILPLLVLLGRQAEAIATAHELGALFPADTRPRLMAVLARSLSGDYAGARTSIRADPPLASRDREFAEFVVAIIEGTESLLAEVLPEVCDPSANRGRDPITAITRTTAMAAKVAARLPRSKVAHAPSLRVAPCVRRQFAPFVDIDLRKLCMDLLRDTQDPDSTMFRFCRDARVLANSLHDPLLTFLTDQNWRTAGTTGAMSFRDSEARLALARTGQGPFASWPIARRLASTWRVSLLNQLRAMRGSGEDVPPDLKERARVAAFDIIAIREADADEAGRAASIVAAFGDTETAELLAARWELNHPGHAWPPYARGRLAEFTKDHARAVREFDECLRRNPDYPKAREARERAAAALAASK